MKRSILVPVCIAAACIFTALSCGGGGNGENKLAVLFFAGDETGSGNFELYAYNGVSSPSKVAEINSGPNGSNPFLFTPYDGNIYFRAITDEKGSELWATDGSSAWLVTDISTGAGSSSPLDIMVAGGSLYFRTQSPEALWKTDGTASGTVEIAGSDHPFKFTAIKGLTSYGGELAFTGSSTRGTGLYSTDGTAAGTTELAVGFTSVGDLAAFGTTVLFSADVGGSGLEPWYYYGSPGSANMVEEIESGPGGSNPHTMVTLGDKVVFEATRTAEGAELWESDGTAAGTTLVADIYAGPDTSLVFEEMFLYQNRVYFTAKESATEAETWFYNGSNPPERLADINPGTDGSWGTNYQSYNGLLYISAYNPAYDNEMWVSDGSAAGTTLAFDLAPAGSGVLGD